MVRPKTAVANGPSGAAKKSKNQRLSSVERSAHFARREAAKVLRSVLQGDARRRALGSIKSVQKDDMVPDLLILPPGCDLHDHSLVTNGRVFLQGKASSMVATAPELGWKVIDACSAPGNKTVHLAALMKGKGKIIACELYKERIKCLEETIRLSGADDIEVLNGDFLKLHPKKILHTLKHDIGLHIW